MENKVRPSNIEVSVYCKGCNKRAKFFMTLKEIYADTKIKQPCKECDKITEWSLS